MFLGVNNTTQHTWPSVFTPDRDLYVPAVQTTATVLCGITEHVQEKNFTDRRNPRPSGGPGPGPQNLYLCNDLYFHAKSVGRRALNLTGWRFRRRQWISVVDHTQYLSKFPHPQNPTVQQVSTKTGSMTDHNQWIWWPTCESATPGRLESDHEVLPVIDSCRTNSCANSNIMFLLNLLEGLTVYQLGYYYLSSAELCHPTRLKLLYFQTSHRLSIVWHLL